VSDRVDWHTYFMNIARQVAARSTCSRKLFGAVIVRDRTILSTGYNGSIRGCCTAGRGCLVEDGHCVATVRRGQRDPPGGQNGVSVAGAEIYTTASPCWRASS
jgi:dCMP deaminase